MKNLNLYIEELLYRHQCVIIPDFGAFVSNRRAAELTQNNTFSPPQKELTFNSRLTYNDGLVAKYISESENISYEDAQEHIRSVVEQWKEALATGQTIVFDNIGSFHSGKDNNIIFEPAPKENFLTDSFGMSSITAQQINKDENQPNSVLENTEEAPTENPIVTPQEAAAGRSRRKLPSLVKYAAVAIVGLSAISFGVYSYFSKQSTGNAIVQIDPKAVENRVNEHISQAAFLVENPIEIPEVSLNVKKDPVLVRKKQAQEKALEKQQTTTQVTQQPQVVETRKESTTSTTQTVQSVKNTSGYHLIAGAFSTEQNANTRVKQLQDSGYANASIVGKNGRGLFLVAYKSFNTQSDANAYKQELNSKGVESWVYISK